MTDSLTPAPMPCENCGCEKSAHEHRTACLGYYGYCKCPGYEPRRVIPTRETDDTSRLNDLLERLEKMPLVNLWVEDGRMVERVEAGGRYARFDSLSTAIGPAVRAAAPPVSGEEAEAPTPPNEDTRAAWLATLARFIDAEVNAGRNPVRLLEIESHFARSAPSSSSPTMSGPQNQCDGCVKAMAIKAGIHYTRAGAMYMGCTADRYASPPATATPETKP